MTISTCTYQYPGWPRHAPCLEPAWDDHGRCFFHSARPDKPANEMAARVKERLGQGVKDFIGYVFPAGVDFGGVDFGEGASFFRATFGDGAFFFDTTFGERADFSGATFGERADFGGADFGDGAVFRIANPKERFILPRVTFKGRADFSGETQDWSHLELHGVSLPQAVFRGAIGLDKAEFDNVTWGSRGSRQGVLGDEEVARQSEESADFAAAERVYREIRRSYLERRDFTMDLQMHWGEMEMRRLGEAAQRREAHKRLGGGPLAHISLTTAYWLVSGYGQRWLNALVALALLWLVCGALFAVLGVQFPASPVEVSHAFGDGLIQSALSLVLHPTDYAQPATAWGWLVEFLELVLSPIVITALVLAVREQFRH